MKIYTKYPIKIGEIIVPKSTEVKLADINNVRKVFSDINYKINSDFVAIEILDLECYIVLKKQLTFN